MRSSHSLLLSGGACALAAILAGCGGGGSGGGNGTTNPTATPNPTTTGTPSPTTTGTPAPTTTPTPGPTSGPVNLLRDDFNGASLSGATWGLYDQTQTLQRTKFGFSPAIVNEGGLSFARLRLDTFNPDSPGTFKGTEFYSKVRFARRQGLEMTARMRAPGVPPGVVLAFFGIYDRYTGVPSDATYLKDEIDYEILTAQQEQFSPADARNRLYLNTWNDWNLSYGFDENDGEDGDNRIHDDKTYAPAKAAGYDYANWNIYTIRWLPDRTEFYLNGTLERVEREVKTDEDLSVHFNMWVPIKDFRLAYSDALQPAATQAEGKTYNFDVDYVTVTDLGGAASARTARQFTAPPIAGAKSYRSR